MDFGIDTIVYIILGLVFLVAQANKKKKAQAQKISAEIEEDGDDDGGSPPGLLEEFFGQNESSVFDQNTVDNNAYPQEAPPPLFTDSLRVDEAFFDNVSEETNEDLPKDKFEEPVDDSDDELVQVSEFDLRNAVIYSAILERKYF
ncbi:MAG: hypothetical protein U9N86_15895 [Bacteroidota bacterium]|nr:hypothetical protein [Bacteroidota bacterium]